MTTKYYLDVFCMLKHKAGALIYEIHRLSKFEMISHYYHNSTRAFH